MVEHLGNPNSTSFGEEYESYDSHGAEDKAQTINTSVLLRHVSPNYPMSRISI